MIIHPVVLAGGSGARLWPKSRRNYPKPFLRLTKKHTLLQATIQRLEGIPGVNAPVIVCNENHGIHVSRQLSEINRTVESIILEPAIKNTAPALTLAALHCQNDFDDSILLCLPADHAIKDQSLFSETILNAVPLARNGGVVTFGIPPDKPETEYGYIGYEKEDNLAYKIREFVEKPELKDAQTMIQSGSFLWNSGIFMMRSSVWLKQISRYEPNIFDACKEAYVLSERNGNYLSPNPSKFLSCPPNSIDYAVMEPTSSNRDDMTENWVVPLNVGWSDLGTWKSIWEEEIKDPKGNFTHGNTILESVTNSLVVSEHRAVAVTNVSDLAIVETDDAILVSNLNGISEFKNLINSIEKSDQELLFKRNYEEKPWGNFTILASGGGFQIKLLTVNPQSSTSLQSHQYRSEHWIIIKGISKITKGSEYLELSQNESVFIPAGERHRIENHTGEVVQIIEVQTGTCFGEDDIIRYEDMYGRV